MWGSKTSEHNIGRRDGQGTNTQENRIRRRSQVEFEGVTIKQNDVGLGEVSGPALQVTRRVGARLYFALLGAVQQVEQSDQIVVGVELNLNPSRTSTLRLAN